MEKSHGGLVLGDGKSIFSKAHEHFVNTHRNSELNSRSMQDNLVWSFNNVV
jgi:hypothetical protein